MPPGEGKLHEDIGWIKGTLQSIERKTSSTCDDVKTLNAKITEVNGSKVDKDYCSKQAETFISEIRSVKDSLAKERKPLLLRMKENLTAVVAIGGALVAIGAGIVWLADIVVSVRDLTRATAVQQEKKSEELRDIKDTVRYISRRQPEKIYVPVIPDAGIPSRYARRRSRSTRRPATAPTAVHAPSPRPATKTGGTGP